jgi:hypothetical protein
MKGKTGNILILSYIQGWSFGQQVYKFDVNRVLILKTPLRW